MIDTNEMDARKFLASVRQAATQQAVVMRQALDCGLRMWTESEALAYDQLEAALFELEHKFDAEAMSRAK